MILTKKDGDNSNNNNDRNKNKNKEKDNDGQCSWLGNNVNDDIQKKSNNNHIDSNDKKDKFIKDSIDTAETVTNLFAGRHAFKIKKTPFQE